MNHTFGNYRLVDLQRYLRDRGVTVSGYNKTLLLELAKAVEHLQLPKDPDFTLSASASDTISGKIKIAGFDSDPLKIGEYTSDFTNIPDFGLIDIFNYLIVSKSSYDQKKLKSYKSFEDYRLFYDGHVESLQFHPLKENNINCVFKAKVKPTQRDRTYLKKDFYELWFAVNKEDGNIITGYCECIGGADGVCRHLSAALYELEAFEMKSCTDGENCWVKKPRHHDKPVPVRSLSITKAIYRNNRTHTSDKPHSDLYDPRHISHRDMPTVDQRDIGLKIQEISPDIQCLDFLLDPKDRLWDSAERASQELRSISIFSKAEQFVKDNKVSDYNLVEMCDKFSKCLDYSENEIKTIHEKTEGQSDNKLWFAMRKGLLTASNFDQAAKYIDKDNAPSSSFMKSLLGENQLDETRLPAALKWGRRKEHTARLMYQRLNKRSHFSMKTREAGLQISAEYPFLGCSVDGISTCKCKPQHPNKIVEIKCPYSMRDSQPKKVALEKNIVFNESSSRWEVSSDCPYYAQIQGQLGLYGYPECDLVIYTKYGIHISTATFDQNYFSEMIKKLQKFHSKYLIPNIIAMFL